MGEMDEETDDGLFAWLDRAASTMYLQIGILIILYPVSLFNPDLIGLFSAWLFVPFISWAYRRLRQNWKESMAFAKEITAEWATLEDDEGDP